MSYLIAERVSKSFGDRTIVNSVSLSVRAGEIVGLLGPNGAGKTTSFYMLVGLVAVDSGRILIDEQDITNKPMFARARMGVAYLPQEPSIFRKLSVGDNIMAILETIEIPASSSKEQLQAQLLADLGVSHLKSHMASSLSGGERRRVEIARALALSPKFILLDEPFAGIDPIAIRDIQSIIKGLAARGIGILITDHNVRETLGICERAYILVDGKVLEEGTATEIAESEEAQRYYLGSDFRM